MHERREPLGVTITSCTGVEGTIACRAGVLLGFRLIGCPEVTYLTEEAPFR